MQKRPQTSPDLAHADYSSCNAKLRNADSQTLLSYLGTENQTDEANVPVEVSFSMGDLGGERPSEVAMTAKEVPIIESPLANPKIFTKRPQSSSISRPTSRASLQNNYKIHKPGKIPSYLSAKSMSKFARKEYEREIEKLKTQKTHLEKVQTSFMKNYDALRNKIQVDSEKSGLGEVESMLGISPLQLIRFGVGQAIDDGQAQTAINLPGSKKNCPNTSAEHVVRIYDISGNRTVPASSGETLQDKLGAFNQADVGVSRLRELVEQLLQALPTDINQMDVVVVDRLNKLRDYIDRSSAEKNEKVTAPKGAAPSRKSRTVSQPLQVQLQETKGQLRRERTHHNKLKKEFEETTARLEQATKERDNARAQIQRMGDRAARLPDTTDAMKKKLKSVSELLEKRTAENQDLLKQIQILKAAQNQNEESLQLQINELAKERDEWREKSEETLIALQSKSTEERRENLESCYYPAQNEIHHLAIARSPLEPSDEFEVAVSTIGYQNMMISVLERRLKKLKNLES